MLVAGDIKRLNRLQRTPRITPTYVVAKSNCVGNDVRARNNLVVCILTELTHAAVEADTQLADYIAVHLRRPCCTCSHILACRVGRGPERRAACAAIMRVRV